MKIGHRSKLGLATLGLLALSFCKSKEPSPEPSAEPTRERPPQAQSAATTLATINEFFAAGAPSFVAGTRGDKRSDRIVATQIALIRGFVAPSNSFTDTDIKVGGKDAWPARPVLYGGGHINLLIHELEDTLPLRITADELRIAGKHFEGPGFQLAAVIPKQGNHPEFLLFAGTGTPGIAEINAIMSGPESILIADAFGKLHTGSWGLGAKGELVATLSPAARRIDWRHVTAEAANIAFVEALPARDDEAQLIKDCEDGLATTITRLEINGTKPITIYVSPDARSKFSLTRKGGSGHALPEFQVLHVVAMGGGALVGLVAHEATHLLAYAAFGQAGSALLGEGIAVWVSGQYAGTPIREFAKVLGQAKAMNELFGAAFRALPEQEAYMHGGLLVQAAVALIGITKVGEHLLGASSDTWEEACIAAGTSAEALQAAYAAQFAKPSQ